MRFLLLFPIFLFSITVYLPTENSLPSLSCQSGGGGEEKELLSLLEKDLARGKACQIVENGAFSLQLLVENHEVRVHALHNNKPISSFFAKKGDIHRLSDEIQKTLFGIDGIAATKILFTKRTKVDESWVSEIWTVNSDGSHPEKLLSSPGYSVSPGFFPKSSKGKFFYVSFQDGQSRIYQASFQGKNPTPLLVTRGSQALPAISPLGTHLAFISDMAGRPDLFLQRIDKNGEPVGKPKQLFSQPKATQASPTFSPDGKKIAFVSDKDGSPRIYLLELDKVQTGTRIKPLLLTLRNRENTSPCWSPDGKKLAYSAKVEGIRQIWLYDFATQEEMPLTEGPENKENPSWAPDNAHLVYNTETQDICELYILHIGEKQPQRLHLGPGQKRFPAWSR